MVIMCTVIHRNCQLLPAAVSLTYAKGGRTNAVGINYSIKCRGFTATKGPKLHTELFLQSFVLLFLLSLLLKACLVKNITIFSDKMLFYP